MKKQTHSDRKEAQFEYKCRRCGAVYHNPCCSEELAREIMTEIILFGKGGDQNKGGRVWPTTGHTCKKSGAGIADLLGYRIVEV